MQMYVNYYRRDITANDENPPIGIVLCDDKNEAVVPCFAGRQPEDFFFPL